VSDVIAEAEHRVSPVELYFDLVFVFAFTQVTTLWHQQSTWGGLGRGLLVLAALWWVWASYAWLTNAADAETAVVWVAMLTATGPLFIAALAVPGAFGARRVLFGVAFFAVVAAFVGLYAVVSRGQQDRLAAVLRVARTVVPGAGLVLLAAFVPAGVRPLLWGVALVVGFLAPGRRVEGFSVHPAHFAERHALIVIIALGEALAEIGFGARGTNLDAGVITAVVLGLFVAASFWLAYFDFASSGIRSLVEGRRGVARTVAARDAYTYGHLPMVIGVVLFAFALQTIVADVHAELRTVPAVALCCGSALYLTSFVAIRRRVGNGIGRGRPATAVACALLTVVAVHVPAIIALALLAAAWLSLHAYELVRWREARSDRRSQVAEPTPAAPT
jgi:low temperature requirement protein LtrA